MKIKDVIVKEAVLKQIKPGISAQIQDPEKGITYDIDLSKPEMASALLPDEKGGLQFDPTPQPAGAQIGAAGTTGPQPGQEVTIKTDEESDFEPWSEENDELSNASDRELAHWAGQMGLEDSIVKDGEGGLANRKEIIDLLRQISEQRKEIGGDKTDKYIDAIQNKTYGELSEIKKLSGL